MPAFPCNRTIVCIILLFTIPVFAWTNARSQDVQASISVTEIANRNTISWVTGYQDIRSIGVLWSTDSQYNYSTIGYARQPGLSRNSFTDREDRKGKNFYRLYFELEGGKLVYSNPEIVLDTMQFQLSGMLPASPRISIPPILLNKKKVPMKIFLPPYIPSVLVYTNPEGNVNITLPHVLQNQYSLKFFDSTGIMIFDIPRISRNFLILDKSNFLHSGWFHYELFDNDLMKSRGKLFIPDQPVRPDQ